MSLLLHLAKTAAKMMLSHGREVVTTAQQIDPEKNATPEATGARTKSATKALSKDKLKWLDERSRLHLERRMHLPITRALQSPLT